jgi:DNA sulfur modification protein DndD
VIGYECLGSISAAERELLALSFTLALHKVSGFDSPILIDTPVARVSDQNRENLGRVFSEVGRNRQIILLFTPAEFSEEISKILDRTASTRRILELSADERETKLEVL